MKGENWLLSLLMQADYEAKEILAIFRTNFLLGIAWTHCFSPKESNWIMNCVLMYYFKGLV